MLPSRYVHMATEYNRPGSYPGAEPPPADGDFRGRFDCYGRSMVALKTKEEMDKCESGKEERKVCWDQLSTPSLTLFPQTTLR